MSQNKVAVVTGSSRGIGAAIAKALAFQGVKVLVNYAASEDRAQQVVGDIAAAGGTAFACRADVTNPSDITAMIETAERELGPVDILVNNAGINFPIVPFSEYRWEDFEHKLNNELKATFHTCQAVLPGMTARKSGSIVNISSTLSRQPGPGFVAHSSAKSAIDGFTKALALELGPVGIRVNAVAPGLTLTDATSDQPKEMHEAIKSFTPMRRLGEPEDVAATVAFLCSDQARHITGGYIAVSGGAMMI
ncbi:3-oxoacyl-ACP reductase FabG [Thalassospira sp. MA62]|nr:3-oxoacyl-ACP reductase FabG [Thalassospira sp. MA62]